MAMMTLFASICVLLTCLMMIICYMISMKTNMEREKSSPFECGFSPNKSARLPFSLQFFLVAVVFLIFDMEITLLLPVPLIMTSSPTPVMSLTILLFIIILLLGLYYEWAKGMLDWMT